MPKLHGQGHSKMTPVKQSEFKRFMCRHVLSVQYSGHQYIYIDLNAGEGFNPETGADGSPMISRKVLSTMPSETMQILIERETAETLKANLAKNADYFPTVKNVVLNSDNGVLKELIDELNRREVVKIQNGTKAPTTYHGLVYADPNATLDWGPLINISKSEPMGKDFDILIHITATMAKRLKERWSDKLEFKSLKEGMKSVNKMFWYITAPKLGDKFQWVFLFGTNDILQKTALYSGMRSVDYGAGKSILEYVSRTEADKKENGYKFKGWVLK